MKRIIMLTLLTGLFMPCVSSAVDLPKIDRKKVIQFLKDKPAEIAVGVAGIAGTIMALVGYAGGGKKQGPVATVSSHHLSYHQFYLQCARAKLRSAQIIADNPVGWIEERKAVLRQWQDLTNEHYNLRHHNSLLTVPEFYKLKAMEDECEKKAVKIANGIAAAEDAVRMIPEYEKNIIPERESRITELSRAHHELLPHASLQRYRLLMYAGIVLAAAAAVTGIGYGIHKAIEHSKAKKKTAAELAA